MGRDFEGDLILSFRISPTEEMGTGNRILLVAGSITRDAADLLEKVCLDLLERQPAKIILNLNEVSFVGDYGAKTLCRLKRNQRVSLEGLCLFTKQVVETTDKSYVTNRHLLS